MILRELFAKIGFEIDEKSVSKVEKTIESIKHGLEALGVEEAVRRSYEFVADQFERIANTASQLEHLATKTGLSTTSLQQLQFAAKMVDIEASELQMGLVHLARSAQEAATQGGAAGGAFRRLGVDTSQLVGPDGRLKSMDKLLALVADRFQAATNPAEKLALAQELFSRSGQNMLPLLNQGSAGIAKLGAEALKTGSVMNERMVREGAALDDSLKRLHASITGLSYAIFGPFVKAWTEGKDSFARWLDVHRKMIAMRVGDAVRMIGQAFEFATAAVKRFSVAFAVVGGAILAVTFPILTLIGVLGLLAEDVYSYTQGRDSLTARLIFGFDAVAARIKKAFGEVKDYLVGLFPDWMVNLFEGKAGGGAGPGPTMAGPTEPDSFLGGLMRSATNFILGPPPSMAPVAVGGGLGPFNVTQHIYGGGSPEEVAGQSRDMFQSLWDTKMKEAKRR